MATLASHSDVMGNLFIGKYLCSVLGYGWKIMFGVSVLGGLAVFVVAMYGRWRAEELQLKSAAAMVEGMTMHSLYRVIQATDPTVLEADINNLAKSGFTLHGSISAVWVPEVPGIIQGSMCYVAVLETVVT